MKQQLTSVIDKEEQSRLNNVQEWLAVESRSDHDHVTYQEVRFEHSSTTDWILNHEKIKDWVALDNPTTPLLWMHGIPGAGKTILASTIIDCCSKKADFSTRFFYCHDGDQSSNTAMSILKGLIGQFLNSKGSMVPLCYARRTTSTEPILRANVTLARKLLEELCLITPKAFIIVDGLDECINAERKQITDILMDLVGHCNASDPGKLRVLLVSQYSPDIYKSLHSSTRTSLRPGILTIEEKDNRSEIHTYVASWVDQITQKFQPMSDELRDYLTNVTVNNSKGMFLYAKLVMSNLYHQPTRLKLEEAIREDNFPHALGDAYERIIRRIRDPEVTSPQEWEIARKLLGWMIYAPSIECEMAVLCLEYLTFPCFELEADPHIEDILEGCFAFQDYAIAKWFYHVNAFVKSGPEFLREVSNPEVYLDALSATLDNFTARFDERWDSAIVEDCRRSCEAFDKYNLYDNLLVLTSHIYTHQQKGFDARHKISIKDLDSALVRNRKCLEDVTSGLGPSDLVRYQRFFFEGFRDANVRDKHVKFHTRPYHCDVPDCLGEHGFVNQADLDRHVKVFHPEMVDLSEIFKPAQPKPERKAGNAFGTVYSSEKRTPNLWRKAYEALNDEEKGRERLQKVNTLLKEELGKPEIKLRKAQDWTTINASDDADMRELKESLQSVFVSLYKAIIFATAQLMISLNGNFQYFKNVAKHYDWAGQLETLNKRQHRVSEYMHSKEWQEALEPSQQSKQQPKRDLRNAMGPGPRNPLHWAAALGVPENVAFYVQNKEYPINALTKQSWTAAHLAAREGRVGVMKILLTAPGIDLSIKNREGRTPLHIAAIHNRKWIAKLLLKRSPKLLLPRDKWDRTAFIIAAEKGHVDILKVLQKSGQDMNETTVKKGWTALHLAAENGHVEAVQWLLENGTAKSTQIRDGPEKGMTAKQVAELKGRAQIVELFKGS
ncbi:hypothetical protein E8E13_003411 [Curvularia kusanoi]|uniref:Nephrocystin 3-like N-terminal domain-containing protein n=1 Tax=Curvularia kusanoi TaxID=90978 RepID=A0A9P4W8S3_CURKU|nr:hypothetical protein E8E13_003411 [Curvularia kusanoi]